MGKSLVRALPVFHLVQLRADSPDLARDSSDGSGHHGSTLGPRRPDCGVDFWRKIESSTENEKAHCQAGLFEYRFGRTQILTRGCALAERPG